MDNKNRKVRFSIHAEAMDVFTLKELGFDDITDEDELNEALGKEYAEWCWGENMGGWGLIDET